MVAVFEEIWVDEVERQLAKADKKAVKQADKKTADEVKKALAETKKQASGPTAYAALRTRGAKRALTLALRPSDQGLTPTHTTEQERRS